MRFLNVSGMKARLSPRSGTWNSETLLIGGERRGRLNAADVTTRLELIGDLPITTDDETCLRALRETFTLARAESLTTYDAAYLEVAMRRGLPLASKDRDLVAAANGSASRPSRHKALTPSSPAVRPCASISMRQALSFPAARGTRPLVLMHAF